MAVKAGTAYIDVEGDFSTFRKQIRRETGDTRKRFSAVGKAAAAGLGAGLGLAAVGAKKSVDAAVDLGEQVNKTRVVFRGSEKDILRWSKTTATAIGTSRREALEAAGVFGNMLVPMGVARGEAGKISQRMVKLAADMASFNNASPAETLDALRAGLAGETEPLRRFGVFLSAARLEGEAFRTGIAKSGSELTAKQKALATYSVILKDTKDAQGDFARTSGSLANQERILKAQIEDLGASAGKLLVPALTSAAQGTSKFIKEVQTGKGAGGEFAATVKQIWTDAKPVVSAFAQGAVAVGKFAAKHPEITKVATAVGLTAVAFNKFKVVGAVNAVAGFVRAVGGTPVKVRDALGGVRALMSRIFGRAGTAGGTALATNAADTAASSIGGRVSRKSGQFRSAGTSAGRVAGNAAGTTLASRTAAEGATGMAVASRRGGKLGKAFIAAGRALGPLFAVAIANEIAPTIEREMEKALGEKTVKGHRHSQESLNPGAEILRDLIPGLRRGGVAASMVSAVLSPGEVGITPDGGAFRVPGPRVAADTVPMMLRPGTAVLTGSGQRMLARGASLGEAIRRQAPHFAKGGMVGAVTSAQRAGFRSRRLVVAGSVAGAETSNFTDMIGDESNPDGPSFGPWQVLRGAHPQYDHRRMVRDWDYAAKAAYEISDGGRDWSPWTVFRTGAYRRFEAAAKKAVGLVRRGESAVRRGSGFTRITPAPISHPLLGNMLAPLTDDALVGGITAGMEGTGRRALLTEVLEGIVPESGDRATRERIDFSFGERDRPRGRGGKKASGPIAARIAAMQQFGDKYAGRPYVYGGGHGALGVPSGNPPSFDCSGYVSGILAAGGALSGSPLTTVGLVGWGKPGPGRNVTVGVRGGAGMSGHTMIKVGDRYYEAGGGGDVGRRSGWNGTFTSWRHPAWRKGGIVGFRRGGMVEPSPEGKRHLEKLARRKGVPVASLLDPNSRAFVGWGMRRGGIAEDDPRFNPFTMGGRDIGPGFDFMRWLRRWRKATGRRVPLNVLVRALGTNQLGSGNADRATRVLSNRVQGRSIGSLLGAQKRARDQIRQMARKGFTGPERIRTRRLRGAISLLQDEMGRPIGRMLGRSDRTQERVDRQGSRLSDELILRNIDPDSVEGLTAQRGQAFSALGALQTRRAELGAALKRAKRTGNRQAVQLVQAEIREVDDQILGLKSSIEQLNDSIQAAMPTAEDFANRDLALAQLTETLDDDLAALRNLEGLAQKQLDAALQTADPRDDTEAATNLKGVRDSIETLTNEMAEANRREEERKELDKQLLEERRKLRILTETQGPALLAAVIAAVEGGIVGPVGIGRVPGVPGMPAAYRT